MVDLKEYLDNLVATYENPDFIEEDPINFPHRYSIKEDIEISGFLSSIIAWGKRTMIVKNTHRMAELMGDAPFDFIMSSSPKDLDTLSCFVHRTFNGEDFKYFVLSLRNIYQNYGGLQYVFERNGNDLKETLSQFYKLIFEAKALPRTLRHISSIDKGSACKRLNMYLRWMVRPSTKGVDFGIWNGIAASSLWLPLDVHSANTSRYLGLLKRAQNDWKAVEEVTLRLRELCPDDPIKYDFALFSAGIEGAEIPDVR